MIRKKGIISIQLNWIFIMIIGAIILIFFMTIVNKQKEYSEENIAGTVQTDLQAIFSSSHVSTGTSSIIEVPNQDIEFSCEGFKIGRQFPAHYPYAFAPDLIKSDRNTVSVYAYDWSVPYRVTNFLYITSPDVRYVIDSTEGTQELRDALDSILPPIYITKDGTSKLFMNRNTENPADITDSNNYKIKIISFQSCGSIPFDIEQGVSTKPKDISLLCIDVGSCPATDPEDQLDCYGDLQFFNYNGHIWLEKQSKFVGKASLLAAIFSENQEIYECGMNNSFKRLEKVTDIYISKTDALNDLLACTTLYESASEGGSNGFLYDIKGGANPENPSYSAIYNALGNLESTNNDLLANSCSPIY